MTSLVTGGAGFIGSHVVDSLISKGHQVVVLDDLSGGDKRHVNPKAVFVQGSIVDQTCVDKLFKQYCFDYVFHLAAYAAVGLSHFIKRFNYMNNVVGSMNVINAAVNSGHVKCFIFASSISVYGEGRVPMDEGMVPLPIDPYGISKYTVEMELECTRRMFGLPYIIFRPYNVYGERQNIVDKSRNVVGIFMNQALRHEPFTVVGDGLQKRAFSYIDDVAPVIAASCAVPQAYNQVFNVGAGEVFSIVQLAQAVAKHMGVAYRVKHLPPRDEAIDAYCTQDRVRKYFGAMIHDVPLETGIAKMAAWAKTLSPQTPQVFQQIEITRNLPADWR